MNRLSRAAATARDTQPQARPGLAEADLLIRNLESQMRRQRDGGMTGPEFSAGLRRWAERFRLALPEFASEAEEIATTFSGDDDHLGTSMRLERIGTAMRLLARLRSHMAGETPRQVMLPGASGPPPEAVPSASSAALARGRQSGVLPPAELHLSRSTPNGQMQSAPTQPITSEPPARALAPAERPVHGPDSPKTFKRSGTAARPKGKSTPRAPNSRATTPKGVQPKNWCFDTPIEQIATFKGKFAAPLSKLHIRTVGDMLYKYPRRHLDYSKLLPIAQLRADEEATIEASVMKCNVVHPVRGRVGRVEATFHDTTGTIRGTWFGPTWRARELMPGRRLYVSGKVRAFMGQLQFSHADYEDVTDKEAVHTGRLIPVYKLSGELPGKWLRGQTKLAVDNLAYRIEDHLSAPFLQRWNLAPLHAAIQQIHFPDDDKELQIARRRIAFDDLFLLQLGLLKQKQEWQRMRAIPLPLPAARLAEFVARLPFTLTAAQQQALGEVLADIGRDVPMGRLLQGDVGSGKTVVAALAALAAVENGCQAAIVAPTEVLAEQHVRTLAALFAEMIPMLKPVLITGSLTARARSEAWKHVGSGQAAVVVGTHALFSERGEFARLALVVIDEQHRFGVYQRDTLWRKGQRPHLLAMTATPIPRTLALQKFGDLDLSVIDVKPVGRQSIITRYAVPEKRKAVYEFVRTQVGKGRQAFVICPLVDENELLSVKAVTTEYRQLREEVFPGLSLGLLHGRMKAADKDDTMRRFRDGQIQILVATTVIEVGVDVPNATVMLIEGAERFGLAQLHQLRGRVGRGEHQSYCVLLASEAVAEDGEQRLRLVESNSDGFALAEADLVKRRTGTFFGSEQSGDEGLLRWVAYADPGQARQAAEVTLARDPDLALPEHALLATRVAKLLAAQRKVIGATTEEDGETASLAYV